MTLKRVLLILDLDDTLIHSTGRSLESRPHDFMVGLHYVYCRPHLKTFLTTCSKYYDLAIWSSGGSDYVREILAGIMPRRTVPIFVWARDRCTPKLNPETQDTVFQKDLRKARRLGFPLERMLIVEDTPANVRRDYGNAIVVSSYYGDSKDDELVLLTDYLVSIHSVADVRKLEKRGWRHKEPT